MDRTIDGKRGRGKPIRQPFTKQITLRMGVYKELKEATTDSINLQIEKIKKENHEHK